MASADSYTVPIGLRSGKVVTVTVSKDRAVAPVIDAAGVTVEDVGWAAAGVNLFSNQLYRPTTVAEHLVTLSYLLPTADQQLAALLLGSGDLLAGSRLPPSVRQALTAAIFGQLKVSVDPLPAVSEVEAMLVKEEILLLHPARNFLVPRPDDQTPATSGLTLAQQGTVKSRVNKPPFIVDPSRNSQDEYTKRWAAIIVDDRTNKNVEAAVQSALTSAGFWPHRINTTAADISNAYRVPFAKVATAVEKLVAQGTLVQQEGYYHAVGSSNPTSGDGS